MIFLSNILFFTNFLRGVKLENYFGDAYIVGSSMHFMSRFLATVVLH